MKFALVLLLSLSVSAFAAEKKAAAKGKSAAKSQAKTAAKRGPASTDAGPAAPSKTPVPAKAGGVNFTERVIGDKTVVCGYVAASVSCVVVNAVAH